MSSVTLLSPLRLRAFAVLAVLLAAGLDATPAVARETAPTTGSIYGRITMRGRGLSRSRTVRVDVSPIFPLIATPAARSVGGAPGGPDTKARPGFRHLAPVFVGPDHWRVRVPIELDPVHAVVATRFRPARGKAPMQVGLTFAALMARDPATGAPLKDATVTLEVGGTRRPLTYDPTFPGGAFVLHGDGGPAPDRFVFDVTHPALGKLRRRIALHSRNLGSEPVLLGNRPTHPVPGNDLRLAWHQAPWANFASVEVFAADPAGAWRRIWPAAHGLTHSVASPVTIPGKLFTPGRRLRIRVVAGRADVRAENGEIWATAATELEVTVAGGGARPTGTPRRR
jgi:hypothetical protein